MNNPMEIIKTMIGKGATPKDLVLKMMGNNPMISNLVNMANSGNTQGVETFARNLFRERGMDFDKEFSQFMSNFK